MPCTFNTELLHKYEQDGFLVVENFVSDEDIQSMSDEIDRIVNNMNVNEHRTVFSTTEEQPNLRDEYFLSSADKVRFFFEDRALDADGNLLVDKSVSLNKIGHALHVYSPAFQKVTFSDKVKSLLRCLSYVDPVVMQSMFIFKSPGIGGEVMPHQDTTYLHTEPTSLMGLWLALDDATLENGCISFIPGSHKRGLCGQYRLVRPSGDGTKCVYTGEKVTYDSTQFVAAPVPKGSLVLIHGLVVHQSEHNNSSKSRHAYTWHLYDAAVSEWSPANWLQPTPAKTFTRVYDV